MNGNGRLCCPHLRTLGVFQGTAIRDRIQERLRGQQSRDSIYLLQNGKGDEDEEYYYDDDDDAEYYDDEEYYDEEDEKNKK